MRRGIVGDCCSALDAGVACIREWLLGLAVNNPTIGCLFQRWASPGGLGLRKLEWIPERGPIKNVMSVSVFGECSILAGLLQSFHIRAAACSRNVIVRRAMKYADGLIHDIKPASK